ncbi:MAG: protease SohB, partial [Gammaproteobacteria bacterium HGW-Gammaproteobacteria-14]
MVEFFLDYGMFLAKIVTVVVALLFVFSGIATMAVRQRSQPDDGYIRVRNLNQDMEDLRDGLRHEVLSEEARKADVKKRRKDEKAKRKAEKKM